MSDNPPEETPARCDPDQLAMLKRCSDTNDITEWNQWREDNPDTEVWLQGADLREAHLEGADLRDAHLEGAHLRYAHLEGADLLEAHLEGADLYEAHLEGADLYEAHLERAGLVEANLEAADLWGAHLEEAVLFAACVEGADLRLVHLEGASLTLTDLEGARFQLARVNGDTLINTPFIDRDTSFDGVALGGCRITAGLKQTLEYSIRRKRWGEWYRRRGWWEYVYKWPVWLFWWTSNYGRSTWRLIVSFFGFALLFACTYFACDGLVVTDDGGRLTNFLHALYFSVVTMTTLGFGDIHASPTSPWGQVFLMLQVILGYVLLGALVCRLAVLFQADGPAVPLQKPSYRTRLKREQRRAARLAKGEQRRKKIRPNNAPAPTDTAAKQNTPPPTPPAEETDE